MGVSRSFPARAPRRRGVGVVFLIAMGILVVLVVLLFAQSRTQDATGKEILASALGSRGQAAVESCLVEVAYQVLEKGSAEATEDPLHQALRDYVPGEPRAADRESLLDSRPLFVRTFEGSPALTAEAYAEEGDVELGETRVGMVGRWGFPGEAELLTRDHRGVLALEQEVVVTPAWGGFSMKVTGSFQRSYRAVTLAVPAPFAGYTALVKEASGDGNRFRAYHDGYVAARARHLAQGGGPEDLPDFPVADMEGSVGGYFATTVPSLPPEGWNVDALATYPGSFGVSQLDDLKDAFALLQAGGWRRLTGAPVEELERHLRLLSPDGLGPRSSFELEGMADLAGYFGEGEELHLDGVVHVKGTVVLEHTLRGRAVLWTDAPGGVTIRKLALASNLDGLVVVSTSGDIRLEVPEGTRIPASLLAPRGTVRGLDGVALRGHLLMGRYPPDMVRGPTQERPAAAVSRPEPGAPLDEAGRRAMRVLFDPGFVRKDMRRRRLRGLLGGGA